MVPAGSELVVMVSAEAMDKVKVADAVFFGVLLSLTVTVTLPEKGVVGVPVMAPVEALMVSVPGRPLADHVYGVVPFTALRVAL